MGSGARLRKIAEPFADRYGLALLERTVPSGKRRGRPRAAQDRSDDRSAILISARPGSRFRTAFAASAPSLQAGNSPTGGRRIFDANRTTSRGDASKPLDAAVSFNSFAVSNAPPCG